MKIKVTENQKEFEGTIKEGRVTPFGTSAHIPFMKKHLGKVVNVIIPEKPEYVWLFNQEDKDKLIKLARKTIKKQSNGSLTFHKKAILDDLKEDKFDITSLEKVLDLVKDKELVDRIKGKYNLK